MQAQSVIPLDFGYVPDMAGRPTSKIAPPFGQRLASLRKQRGWTQSELAKQLNTTVKMVTYYEREAANPTAEFVAKIANLFSVSTDDLLGVKPERKASKPGPPSRVEERLMAIKRLSRDKQKVVLQFLDSFLETASR